MTGKERILIAFSNRGEADRVPFEPGLDFDSWPSLLGLNWWEYAKQGHTAFTDLINYADNLGFDFYYYGADIPKPNPEDDIEIGTDEFHQDDICIIRTSVSTPLGKIQQLHRRPRFGPEYTYNKLIKDINKDWPVFKKYFGEYWDVAPGYFDLYKRAGDKGVVGVVIHSPIDFWQEYRHGGAEQMIYDLYDNRKVMDDFFEYYKGNSTAYLESVVKLQPKPDFVMIHGSSCSASLISPDIFRYYVLPYIRDVSAFLKKSGICSLLHICGRSNNWLNMIADTDIDVIDALERPTGGNVDLAEIKKRYGSKLCLKGNVSALTMANGTLEQVRTEVKQCIDAAAEGGGFMLAVGDSIGPKVKKENVEEFVKTALEYGQY